MDYKITVDGEKPSLEAPEEEKEELKDEDMIQAALDRQLFLIERPPDRNCEACKGTGSLGRDLSTGKVSACECVGEARDQNVRLSRENMRVAAAQKRRAARRASRAAKRAKKRKK